jgi:leucyl/phenylalanyl-tRNA--protein transferase
MDYNGIEFLDGTSDDFPQVLVGDPYGLIAIGGNLKVSTLIKAYRQGLFPWFEDWSPIMWYSPPMRCIISNGNFKASKSLKQKINRKLFSVTADRDFANVLNRCATVEREDQNGTWIDERMASAYVSLHQAGYAHSIEVWSDGELAGGLYGVSLGRAFFGESMFHQKKDASKVALYYLCNWLDSLGFNFVDAQIPTPHLLTLGGIEISRADYLKLLHQAMAYPDFTGSWTNAFNSYHDK